MSATTQHRSSQGDLDVLLDMYGTLKDEVMELRERSDETHARRRSIAPGHTQSEAWAPCSREEVQFYGSLSHLQ